MTSYGIPHTQNEILPSQNAVMIFLTSFFLKLSSLPALIAKELDTSAFIVIVFFCLFELILSAVVYFLQLDGAKDAIDKSRLKYPLYALMCLYFCAKLFFSLGFIVNFVTNFLFESIPVYVVILTFLLPVIYLGYKGIKTIGRTAQFFFAVTVICLFLLLAFLKINLDMGRLLPIFSKPPQTVFESMFGYGLWLGDSLPLVLCKIKRPKKFLMPISCAASYGLITVVTMISVAAFGSALYINHNLFVNLAVFNQLSSVLGRLQYLSIIPWMVASIVSSSILFWSASTCAQTFVKNEIAAKATVALIIVIAFLAIGHSDVLIDNSVGYLGYVMTGAIVVIALSVLIINAVRRKKNAKTV